MASHIGRRKFLATLGGAAAVSGRSRHWIKSKNSNTTAMMTKSALAGDRQ
jgi:hypothetical protein